MDLWRNGEAVVFGPGEDDDTEHVDAIAETAEDSEKVEMRRAGLHNELVAVRPAPDRSPCGGCGGCGPEADVDGGLSLVEIAVVGLLAGIGVGVIVDELSG
jgi:hypothetical protein